MNKNTNPRAHKQAALYVIRVPYIVASHLKNLIPVGTTIIIVANVKYARVATSIPTVNMCCAHTTNPSNPIASMAKIIPRFPNASFFPLPWQIICEIIANPGKMRIYTSGCEGCCFSSNIPHTEHTVYAAAPRTSNLLQHYENTPGCCNYSLMLLKMGKIIARNMLS